MHSVFRAGTRAVPNRGVLNEKNSGGQCISPPGGGRVPRALIRIPKNEGTRARARAITKIGWPVRSQRLVFFGTMKPSLKTKGVTTSIPGLGFAELSAFRFLLLPLSASLLALLFLSPFLSFPFSFFFLRLTLRRRNHGVVTPRLETNPAGVAAAGSKWKKERRR